MCELTVDYLSWIERFEPWAKDETLARTKPTVLPQGGDLIQGPTHTVTISALRCLGDGGLPAYVK